MKAAKILLITSLITSSLSISAQPLELKGVKPGDPMTECPPGSRTVPARTAETLCGLGPTTLANQEASDHLVAFHDGVVVVIMYQLRSRGMNANALVLEALKEKYGDPTISKPHVNDYAWVQGNVVLGLDGLKGSVMLMDRERMQRARAEGAKRGKSDL